MGFLVSKPSSQDLVFKDLLTPSMIQTIVLWKHKTLVHPSKLTVMYHIHGNPLDSRTCGVVELICLLHIGIFDLDHSNTIVKGTVLREDRGRSVDRCGSPLLSSYGPKVDRGVMTLY